jgi:hypothetical protein
MRQNPTMRGVLGTVYGLFLFQVFVGAANATEGFQSLSILPMQALVAGLFIGIIVSQMAALLTASRGALLEVIQAIQFE